MRLNRLKAHYFYIFSLNRFYVLLHVHSVKKQDDRNKSFVVERVGQKIE